MIYDVSKVPTQEFHLKFIISKPLKQKKVKMEPVCSHLNCSEAINSFFFLKKALGDDEKINSEVSLKGACFLKNFILNFYFIKSL